MKKVTITFLVKDNVREKDIDTMFSEALDRSLIDVDSWILGIEGIKDKEN